MGNDLQLGFVFGKGGAIKKLEDLELDRLLTAVAGDIYSPVQIAEMRQKILSSEYQGVRVGGVEIQIKHPSYWFGIGASEETEASVWFSVDEIFYYRYDERAEAVMSDFAKRARAAFEVMEPWYGNVESNESIDAIREAYDADFKPLKHVCWLNYYSPELAAELGNDRIVSAARETTRELGDVTVDELADGAIMLQVGKMPGYVGNIPKRKALESALFGRPCKYDEKAV